VELETLCWELYEDLNGRISAVEFGDVLTIRAECEHWDKTQGRLRFELRCEGVDRATQQTLVCHCFQRGDLYYLVLST
jgi:hypothetical protein